MENIHQDKIYGVKRSAEAFFRHQDFLEAIESARDAARETHDTNQIDEGIRLFVEENIFGLTEDEANNVWRFLDLQGIEAFGIDLPEGSLFQAAKSECMIVRAGWGTGEDQILLVESQEGLLYLLANQQGPRVLPLSLL